MICIIGFKNIQKSSFSINNQSGLVLKMGHLNALLRKNWILWKRNCFCSSCELILPLLLIFGLMGIRSVVEKTDTPEQSFLFKDPLQKNEPNVPEVLWPNINEQALRTEITNKIPSSQLPPGFTQLPISEQLKLLRQQKTELMLSVLPQLKNCIDNVRRDNGQVRMWRNGDVALGPKGNPVAEELANMLQTYYQYSVQWFANNDILDSYIRRKDYGDPGVNRICFGVIFDAELPSKSYTYSLRFNNSGQVNSETPTTDGSAIDPIKLENQATTNLYWTAGTLTIQNFIDNIILRREIAQDSSVTPSFSYVRSPEGVKDEFATFMRGGFGVYLVLPLMIIYLRMTYGLIYEKEKKLREGMKMMGLSNTSFYLSWIIQYIIIYLIISILATILLSAVVFPHTNGGVLFINYFLFCLVLIFQSMFISVFFTRALFGLIVAIVWYLMMYLVISLVGSGGSLVPESSLWAASISSHAAFSFSFDTMVLFEAQGKGVNFDTLDTKIENYSVSIAIVMHILNILFYLFMSIYLDLVFPNEWGKKIHPLFCIPYFNRRHDSAEFKRKMSESLHHDKYEEVEQALKDQETRQEVLKITGLSKVYPSGKAAVTNINLTMYTGQIYALLGHNGAGKTSTLSMLTGLLDITSGAANVFGYDVETQIEEIRSFMGVCPQHDILFDELTVKEHLEMFATFKGMQPEEIPAAVRRMIEDVDLLEKTDYLAKNLSGGQKRRLSVAIAFIGNSKLIYLDEPTSGMDTSARRYIWEMLKNYKEDKIIVLTTHFMDEADFLGDRIGIMGEGKLICSGSSVFLKNQFGSGYNLTIVKETTLVDSNPIIQLVKQQCPEANLLSNVSAEILFQLPLQAIAKFPKLFDEMDKNLTSLKMLSYGISITTLEEVFLKVAEVGAGHHQVKDVIENEQNNHDLDQLDDFDINKIRITSAFVLFYTHSLALLIKRIRYFKRDLRSLCCEVFLPCLVVLCGLALMTISFINDPINIEVMPTNAFGVKVQYGWTGLQTPNVFTNFPGDQYDPQPLKSQSSGPVTTEGLREYDLFYFQNYKIRENIGWLSYDQKTGNNYQYTMFVNSVFRDGPIFLLNAMNSAILKTATQDTTREIKVTIRPLVRTSEEMAGENIVSGFLAALVFSIGMAFIPASVISYIVKEREINIKHQQLVSGVSVKAYWFSNWVMDVGKHIIPSVICCLLVLAFNITVMIDNGNYGAIWLLFFLYGWAIIPFCYLFSFAFKQQGNAMLVNFFLHLLIGSIISLVIYILRLISSTRSAAKGISYVLRLVPSFSFAYGIVNACSRDFYKVIEGHPSVKDVYDWDISGADIAYLAIEGFVYTMLVFLIEYFEDTGELQKLGSSEDSIPYVPKMLDDDVLKENQNCLTADPAGKAILVKNLRKVFMLGGGSYKVAVDNVSFGIDNGEVFGLLGVNGAGKTTTFKMLSGELKPTSGQAWVAGRSVITELEAARVNIGYCPQFDALLDNLTVREHLELFSDVKGIPQGKKEELVLKKLNEMDLLRFEHIQSAQLSGGNKRKLSVAIAMIGNPPIVFLDEPSTGMDPEARRFMWNVISRIATQRKQSTVVLTTHSMEEAEALSTKIAIQVEGNLRCLGSVQHIKSKFGKGYEIESKLEKPTHDEIEKLVLDAGYKLNQRLNMEQTQDILRKLKQEALEGQINMKGYGSHIYNDLRKPNGLAIETLAEFILVENQGFKVMQFIGSELGSFEIIEHFQTFYRFRLTVQITVGKLFNSFEQHKKALRISQYSIKQASIEQIFNNFATQSLSAVPQDVQILIPAAQQEMQPLNQ